MLDFLTSSAFAAMNVQEARDWIREWDVWSKLLNYVLGHEHFAENGRLMVHALSVMDDEAAWHSYWHWVYLAKLREGVAHVTGGFSQHVLLTCYISVRCGALVTGYLNT
jgi:hypothetical protein